MLFKKKQICAPRQKGPLLVNILIVEDDTVIADAIGITLSQAGYHHVYTKTIEEALNELNHNHVDAVLLDINLPDGDGTRLTRLIRKSYLPAPILVISGNSRVDDRITHRPGRRGRWLSDQTF